MPGYLYDVALSFAGAEREYVRDVAVELKRIGRAIFFDEDEQVSLWGENLIERLDEVYREQAQFVVMFVSKTYAESVWTRLERRSALTRALYERQAFVLPARFDDTDLPGLLPSTAYMSLRAVSPQELAKRIDAKITNSGEPHLDAQAGWEYVLFAEELEQGLKALSDLRHEHRIGFVKPTGERAAGVREIPPLIGRLTNEATQWTGNIERMLTAEIQQAAFGAPGESGNSIAIKQLAHSLTRVYQSLIEWTQRLRGIAVPDEAVQLMCALSRFTESPIEQYESFVDDYGRTIRRLVEQIRLETPPENSYVQMDLKFEIPNEILAEYDKAWKKFKRQCRRALR